MRQADCPHCEELRDRIAYLESELGLHVQTQKVDALRRAFRVRPAACHLLLALYAAKGKVVRTTQLEDLIPAREENADRCARVIDVYVCGLRKVLGKDAIITAWAQGYALSPEGMARLAAVLEPIQASAA